MYQQMIREECAKQGHVGMNPKLIEAWMRLEHGCLDGLSNRQFADEVAIAIQLVKAEPEASAKLAKSYGLISNEPQTPQKGEDHER